MKSYGFVPTSDRKHEALPPRPENRSNHKSIPRPWQPARKKDHAVESAWPANEVLLVRFNVGLKARSIAERYSLRRKFVGQQCLAGTWHLVFGCQPAGRLCSLNHAVSGLRHVGASQPDVHGHTIAARTLQGARAALLLESLEIRVFGGGR